MALRKHLNVVKRNAYLIGKWSNVREITWKDNIRDITLEIIMQL